MKRLPILMVLAIAPDSLQAIEYNLQGLLELSYNATDSIDSYLKGGYGKYSSSATLALSQAALNYQISWDNPFSIHLAVNGYLDGEKDALGFTQAFVQYKSLPSASGLRLKLKAGLLRPRISLENVATGWTSPYTLSSSTLNSWVGEELRHAGFETALTRLGKFHQSEHDFTLGASLFQANDPAGAMLAWHGWNLSSRQTLLHETLVIPKTPANQNGWLRYQVPESDPFLELDHRLGYQIFTQWKWQGRGKLSLGYYDNRADPKVVKKGQWAWRTRFYHLGTKWRLPWRLELITQYLNGDTLMQSPRGADLVNNHYRNGFVLLSKKIQAHRITVRVEEFSVDDNDDLRGDDNSEYGKSATFNYSYQFKKSWFVLTEFNWINSTRQSRQYHQRDISLTEQQWRLAVRHFFLPQPSHKLTAFSRLFSYKINE